MSRLSFTVLKHIPVGLWLIALWCIVQCVPAFLLALTLHGKHAAVVMAGGMLPLMLGTGLILRFGAARIAVLAYLWLSLFVGTIVVAILAMIAWYIRLAPAEMAVAGGVLVYYLFMVWAMFYLCHPGVADVFAWNWTQSLRDADEEHPLATATA